MSVFSFAGCILQSLVWPSFFGRASTISYSILRTRNRAGRVETHSGFFGLVAKSACNLLNRKWFSSWERLVSDAVAPLRTLEMLGRCRFHLSSWYQMCLSFFFLSAWCYSPNSWASWHLEEASSKTITGRVTRTTYCYGMTTWWVNGMVMGSGGLPLWKPHLYLWE